MDRSPNTRHNGRLAARRLTLLVGAVLLLAGGADVQAQDKYGLTPLDHTQDPEIIDRLRAAQ